MSPRPIYLVGAGAVGSVIAGGLIRAGHTVTLIIRPSDQARYAEIDQLKISHTQGGDDWLCSAPLTQSHYRMPTNAVLIIAVKHRGLNAVIQELSQAQTPEHIISCLNGMSATQQLEQAFPAATLSTLTVMFNAQLLGPLKAEITTAPELLLHSPSTELMALLQSRDWSLKPCEDSSVAWGKLLINLANALCALTHTTFKDLLTQPALRASFVLTLDEAVLTLQGAGLPFVLPIPLPYKIYRFVLLHGGPLAWWAAKTRNGLSDQSYPSMVADLDQGRLTEVQQLNGEVVSLAATMQRQAPVNQRICELVEQRTQQPQSKPMTPAALLTELQALCSGR